MSSRQPAAALDIPRHHAQAVAVNQEARACVDAALDASRTRVELWLDLLVGGLRSRSRRLRIDRIFIVHNKLVKAARGW